jgi:hypothetical protein
LRSFSIDGSAGLAWNPGKHRIYAMGFAGYRGLFTRISANAETLKTVKHQFEYGGQTGYQYDQWFELSFMGSNNPFNPATTRIYGALPYHWAKEAYPWVDLNLHWLHSLTPLESSSEIGGFKLNDKNLFSEVIVGVPLWRFNSIVPSVLLAADLHTSGHKVHGDVYGGLNLDLDLDALKISAGAAVSPITSLPIFIVKAKLSR